MTLIVALRYQHGVVIACDSRVTYGLAPLMREEPRKIESLGNNIAIMGAGLIGGVDRVINNLKSSFESFKSLTLMEVVEKCEDVLWAFYQKHKERFEEEDTEFPTLVVASKDKIYRVFQTGFAEEEKNYCSEGSGRPYGEYILRQQHKPDMNEKQAKELAVYTVEQTSRIDPNVGGEICLAVVDHDGFRMMASTEVADILESLTEMASAPEKEIQKIVGEIVEKRRWINAVFQKKFGFELFAQNEFAVSEVQKGCKSETDFTSKITALALLIDGMNVSELDKQLGTHPSGSINILETFLKETLPNFEPAIVTNLRDLMVLRSKKMPIHEDDPRLIQVILKWGNRIPPNWSSLWTQALAKYRESLIEITRLLSNEVSEG